MQTAEDVDALEVDDPTRSPTSPRRRSRSTRRRRSSPACGRSSPNIVGPKSDDICYATTNRQIAVKQLARECDLVLVIGSTNSSNSNRLVEVAREHGAASHLIDNALQVRRGVARGRRDRRASRPGRAPPRSWSSSWSLLPRARRRRRLRAADGRRGRPLHAPEGDQDRARGSRLSRRSRARERRATAPRPFGAGARGQSVLSGGVAIRPFGELTAEDARGRAAELKEVGTGGRCSG